MPSDLTGTPTSLGIGTYNTSEDAPSGLGFNEAMAQIDALIAARIAAPASPALDGAVIWNGTAWVSASGGDGSGTHFLADDGTYKTMSSQIVVFNTAADFGPTGISQTGNGDLLFNFPAATFDAVPYYFEMFAQPQSSAGNEVLYFRLHDGTTPGPLVQEFETRTPATSPGNPVFLRRSFTPTAGSHTYQVRWRASNANSYSLVNSTVPLTARIVQA